MIRMTCASQARRPMVVHENFCYLTVVSKTISENEALFVVFWVLVNLEMIS